ncbi:AAEL017231-PA, partial [Aedes aegypti]
NKKNIILLEFVLLKHKDLQQGELQFKLKGKLQLLYFKIKFDLKDRIVILGIY